MSNFVTDEDYGRLLGCIEGIHRCRRLADFPLHVLSQLRKLVACNLACYAEIDYDRQRSLNFFDPVPSFAVSNEWVKFTEDHPVLSYFRNTGDGQALKISDFVNETQYHQLQVYREIYRHTGVEDQFGFGVQVHKRFVLGFAFDRSDRSFTEIDRFLLNLVRPHVVQAYLQLEELASYERLQLELQTALRESGVGVIILNDQRALVYATPGAFEKLASYLPILPGENSLPENIVKWAFNEDGKQTSEPFSIHKNPARLIIRRVRQVDRLMLLLGEENGGPAIEKLTRYQLTPRELEVLRWLAAGKSNAEIGIILGVSAGTAKVHVEHILAKLGVDNRTAAAGILYGLGS